MELTTCTVSRSPPRDSLLSHSLDLENAIASSVMDIHCTFFKIAGWKSETEYGSPPAAGRLSRVTATALPW